MKSKRIKQGVVTILVLSSVYLLIWYFFFSNRFYTVVEGRVYRSAQLSGDELEKYIQEKGIKTILNLRGRRRSEDWYQKEEEIVLKYNVKLHDVRISPGELPKFERLMSIIDVLLGAERPLLIHCYHGVDRTGLVSGIALSIEEDPPIHIVKRQFSLRYGRFPVFRSVGPLIFEHYEKWLEMTNRIHSKNTLLHWMRNEYVDDHANLKYYVRDINGRKGNDKIHIDYDSEELSIRGWAFDVRTESPPDGVLYVKPDNGISSRAIFKHNRTHVAKYFKLGEEHHKRFVVGWEAKFKTRDFSPGCHKIYLELVKDESAVWNFETRFEFCLDGQ